ncbi:GNAT family N-acetyltransferase [Flavobacteriaceae bacterium 3-367]
MLIPLTHHSRFVFELFLEGKVPFFYRPRVVNSITGTTLMPHTYTIGLASPQVYLVQDVGDYLEVEYDLEKLPFQKKIIPQYQGYLVKLNQYQQIDEYLLAQLSKRNRKNLFSKIRKLEREKDVTYQVFFGEITQVEYDALFETFYELLKKRFDEKKLYNRHLERWEALYRSTYPLLLEKKASIFVIYDNLRPITITLNFHMGDVVFSHIQTYDLNYRQYNMGDVSMLRHLEWCFENGMQVFDLSMGANPYKLKWCNHSYLLNYHIFYRSSSVLSVAITTFVTYKLRLMQFLRDKQVIGKLFSLERFIYPWKAKKLKKQFVASEIGPSGD